MFCSKCGKEISEGSLFCSYCGASVSNPQQSQQDSFILTIDRKSQMYLINPPIKVSIDNSIRLGIENGKTENITLSAGLHTIELKASGRSKSLEIDLRKNTVIEIGFNRMTGGIIANIS